MSGNTFGVTFKVTTFGESHGTALGCVIDGCPGGLEIEVSDIEKELIRRRPGGVFGSRNEADKPEIVSGVFQGKTLGTPITIIIQNTNHDSSEYDSLKNIYRPGHADFGWDAKYGFRDYRGGGRSSGRETVSRVAAGAIAKKLLALYGISINAKSFSALSADEAHSLGDSSGGIIRCEAAGVRAGLGQPVFDKLDARLAAAILSIGGCKAIEFGAGFASAKMLGSENNDAPDIDGKITSNNCGGILGGISTGQPVVFNAAFKPTPSISLLQRALDINGNVKEIQIRGRHDTSIVQRAAPVVEAMTALVFVDFLLMSRNDKV
ncbi:MAG: chorismate synthase [Treponema sp.]|nr:chorismate synthase [Treponema sp.]